jgi:hypothetical protein
VRLRQHLRRRLTVDGAGTGGNQRLNDVA